MTKVTTFLPSYESSAEYNAELLRQSVPLMVKNNVSAHPINYAVWYAYAAGNNGKLSKNIDDLVDAKKSFDEETNLGLYRDHICNASIEQFEEINSKLNKLVDTTSNNVQDASNGLSNAGENILANSIQLEKLNDLAQVKSVISDVVTETKLLMDASQGLQEKLNEAKAEMEVLRDELTKTKKLATIDALTSLLNRRSFDDELAELISGVSDYNHCLLILDLDHFKKVNDTFGHIVGDKVIRYTAGLLKKYTASHHHSARYGGEEMAVIMPNTKLEIALEVAENIRKSLASSELKQKNNKVSIGKITVSIGVATLKRGDDSESFIERADAALYIAKDTGRNKVVHQE